MCMITHTCPHIVSPSAPKTSLWGERHLPDYKVVLPRGADIHTTGMGLVFTHCRDDHSSHRPQTHDESQKYFYIQSSLLVCHRIVFCLTCSDLFSALSCYFVLPAHLPSAIVSFINFLLSLLLCFLPLSCLQNKFDISVLTRLAVFP